MGTSVDVQGIGLYLTQLTHLGHQSRVESLPQMVGVVVAWKMGTAHQAGVVKMAP